MQIIILQRLPMDRDSIQEAMEKICPELLDITTISGHLSDVKKIIKAPGVFIKEKKDVLVVTGTVLMDENGDEMIKKIKKWNPGADIVIYSIDPNNISSKKKMAQNIKKRFYKHKTKQCNEELATYIKSIVAKK
jgi:DNA-binding NarL/FixJ family response regulator